MLDSKQLECEWAFENEMEIGCSPHHHRRRVSGKNRFFSERRQSVLMGKDRRGLGKVLFSQMKFCFKKLKESTNETAAADDCRCCSRFNNFPKWNFYKHLVQAMFKKPPLSIHRDFVIKSSSSKQFSTVSQFDYTGRTLLRRWGNKFPILHE